VLSDLAYTTWEIKDGQWVPKDGLPLVAEYDALWSELFQKGYRFIDQRINDDVTGNIGDAPHICRFVNL
jgi:hypothetical protein